MDAAGQLFKMLVERKALRDDVAESPLLDALATALQNCVKVSSALFHTLFDLQSIYITSR